MRTRLAAWIGATALVVLLGDRALADDAVSSQTFSVDPAATTSAPAIDGNADAPIWKTGTHLTLGWDMRHEQSAKDATDVYLLDDAHNLYVAFIAKQPSNIVATQHTDEVGFDTDDEVQIDLWPGGVNGFQYLFTSTPLGTHYSHSSENTTYAPKWSSAGHLTASGYEVTMRIPLNAMRGDGRKTWRVQFVRFEQRAGSTYLWSHAAAQTGNNDVNFSGFLTNMQTAVASTRTKTRVAVYSLASLASAASGGSSMRAGVDWAVPVTPTASFIGTVHPDYSNVDLDQQTIQPTAFARFFQEVRPFFAQGANFYNAYHCLFCPGIQELYTPAIPTPRSGYAFEGTQGPANFGAFDAIGAGRTDSAAALSAWNNPRTSYFDMQRVSADAAPGVLSATSVHDDVSTFNTLFGNNRDRYVYFTYGQDRGTDVLDPDQANREEAGAAWYTPHSFVSGALRSVGTFYAPVDGIVQHPGIAGYNVNIDRWFDYAPTNAINRFEYFGYIDRYQGPTGGFDQTDQDFQVTVNTRNLMEYAANIGAAYVRFGNGTFQPVNLNGPLIGYNMRSSTPTEINYNQGRFGPGFIRSWQRTTGFDLGHLGAITFEGDDTDYTPDSGVKLVQWLEKASLSLQSSRDTSFAIGVRRIIGIAPPLGGFPTYINAANVSFAYHRQLSHDELYLVYGDPNNLATTHAYTIKFVHYFGAEKGT